MGVVRLRANDKRPTFIILGTTDTIFQLDREDIEVAPDEVNGLAGHKAGGLPLVPRDDDGDEDDDEDDGLNSSATASITMTIPSTQPTGSALPSGAQISQPTTRGGSASGTGQNGLSETTHHLLLAAGSVGATIVLVMAILAIYVMRKRNMTFRQIVTHCTNGIVRFTRKGTPPTPPKVETWEHKAAYDADFGAVVKDPVMSPELSKQAMPLHRSDSGSSRKPLVTLQLNDSLNTQTQNPSPEKSFFLESPIERKPSHTRNDSFTSSSPGVLPFQNHDHSHHRPLSSESSILRYPDPPTTLPLSPLPPPPTFKQFLSKSNPNKLSTSTLPAPLGSARINALVSRFSWTNSNAPQTPHDTARDTNSHASPVGASNGIGRDSYMTQRSSVPRFRTIDSWVSQQADRIDETKLKELAQKQARWTAASSTMPSPRGPNKAIPTVPAVPKLPTAIQQAALGSPVHSPDTLGPLPSISGTTIATTKPLRASLPPLPGLPGKNVKHDRTDTRTTVETAPIFRAHPGEEVRFSMRSAVPSEVLDERGGVGRAVSVVDLR